MLASSVMDESAALLNDVAKVTFTYAAQLPLLSKANDELEFAIAKISASPIKQVSSFATMAVGTYLFGLPVDLLSPVDMWERESGSTDSFNLMTERPMPPNVPISSSFDFWSYYNGLITLGPANNLGATSVRQVKLNYIRLLTTLTSSNSVVEIIKSKTFLAARTAGLCARYIGENPDRAEELDIQCFGPMKDGDGGIIHDLKVILIQALQGVPVRRRGYRRQRGGIRI